MQVSTSLYLSAQAQAQLAQLKAANAVPLVRIDGRLKTVATQQSAVTALRAGADALRESLSTLAVADAAEREKAVQAFVAKYNELTNAFKSRTAKGGTLASTTEIRMAQGTLRNPFQAMEALLALHSAGVETTRQGLKVASKPTEAFDADGITQAFESTLVALERRLDAVSQRLDGSVTRLGRERERAEFLVQHADKRTEKSFLKMYQVMQAMQSATSSGGSGLSVFG